MFGCFILILFFEMIEIWIIWDLNRIELKMWLQMFYSITLMIINTQLSILINDKNLILIFRMQGAFIIYDIWKKQDVVLSEIFNANFWITWMRILWLFYLCTYKNPLSSLKDLVKVFPNFFFSLSLNGFKWSGYSLILSLYPNSTHNLNKIWTRRNWFYADPH